MYDDDAKVSWNLSRHLFVQSQQRKHQNCEICSNLMNKAPTRIVMIPSMYYFASNSPLSEIEISTIA